MNNTEGLQYGRPDKNDPRKKSAKPEEQKRGSKKNPKDSASKPNKNIEVSKETEDKIKKLMQDHNSKDPKFKANMAQLKAVFRRGAGAFSTSHAPGMDRSRWGLNRIKAFLYLLRNGRPSNPNYKQDNDLLPEGHPRSTKKARSGYLWEEVDLSEVLSIVRKQVEEYHMSEAQQRWGGKKRSELKDSDFLFPETKSFPIVTPQDVPDAISNFGRMKNSMSYDAFLKKLLTFLKKKGQKFVDALPEATKVKLGLSKAVEDITNYFSKSAESYDAPQAARNNAKKVLEWKDKYGKECKGMTPVGWARARDLARGAMLSADTVKRMAQFNRHRGNYEKAKSKPEYKSKPWTIPAVVAWLGWGGNTGVDWAIRTSQSIQNKKK